MQTAASPKRPSERPGQERQPIRSNRGNGSLPDEGCCVQNPDVQVHGEDKRGAVLLDPRTGQVRGLNATGLFIWRLCDGSRDVPALVAALCRTFEDVPEDIVSDQVVSFLEALRAGGLVYIVESQPKAGAPPPPGDGGTAAPGEPGGESRTEIESTTGR